MCQLFIGFGFPYEGPAPLEAIANGCIFLQPRFHPPHSSLNHEFFRGKPTSREVSPQPARPPSLPVTWWHHDSQHHLWVFPQVSSQHPYAEQYIGRPHVMTVDYNNSLEFESAVREILRTEVHSRSGFSKAAEI